MSSNTDTTESQWIVTSFDATKLLVQSPDNIIFKPILPSDTLSKNTIIIDTNQIFQTIDGFGYALTGGSAQLINRLDHQTKNKLLRELFSSQEGSVNINYIRISIGTSDLDSAVFSYNDLPTNQTDTSLLQFSIERDKQNLIPLLQDILAINPYLKIMASPWSAPSWMKTNNSSIGGSLKLEYYATYARYFVKYIQAMKDNNIPITAITIQNEPENPHNNPSMLMTWQEQANFIKGYLGPLLQKNQFKTKILIFDHNCDNPNYPIQILNDSLAKQYIDGSAFHLYLGNESAMGKVHKEFPNKNIYFTEQWTASDGKFNDDLEWHIEHVILGSLKNYSKVCLEWNLTNDPNYNPHTPGGCSKCKGALTISNNNIKRNVSYYIIAQVSPYILPNSKRVFTNNISSNILSVAFKRPDGKIVIVVLNKSFQLDLNLKIGANYTTITLPEKSVSTFIFKTF
ncbi:MAG: glycoside hydrolase family 30 beta sandwich domain-containing protein [Alphaproteobacteria bacterium]|nr:glycoside hydrolase family 30 beta sandwich domain-containing protein [Alphaproteobacteria bacterium]